MKYARIKPKKIYEEIAEHLHEMIRTGKLHPGERLDSVEQLANSFQVGRSAVREALSALQAMGLIEMRQGEGTFVKSFPPELVAFPLSTAILMNKADILDLLEVRKFLETGAAAQAARKRTDAQLQHLENALLDMKAASGNEEFGERADLAFHIVIGEAAQNPLLSNLMGHVSELMQVSMKEIRRIWLFSNVKTTVQLYNEHRKIYEAIEKQNENEAYEAMLNHLESVENMLERYFHQTNV